MENKDTEIARKIFKNWNRTWKENDLEGFQALYTESELSGYLKQLEKLEA